MIGSAVDSFEWGGDVLSLADAAALAHCSVERMRRCRRGMRAGHFYLPDGRQGVPRDLVACIIDRDARERARRAMQRDRRRKPDRRQFPRLVWSNPNI